MKVRVKSVFGASSGFVASAPRARVIRRVKENVAAGHVFAAPHSVEGARVVERCGAERI